MYFSSQSAPIQDFILHTALTELCYRSIHISYLTMKFIGDQNQLPKFICLCTQSEICSSGTSTYLRVSNNIYNDEFDEEWLTKCPLKYAATMSARSCNFQCMLLRGRIVFRVLILFEYALQLIVPL